MPSLVPQIDIAGKKIPRQQSKSPEPGPGVRLEGTNQAGIRNDSLPASRIAQHLRDPAIARAQPNPGVNGLVKHYHVLIAHELRSDFDVGGRFGCAQASKIGPA